MVGGSVAFVGGCSGSGKTTLSIQAVERNPRVHYVSASALIRTEQGNVSSRPKVASGKEANELQDLLIHRFATVRSQYRHIILDGHFVVPTRAGFHPLSAGVFAALHCSVLVLVETPAEVVAKRLSERADATWWNGDPSVIEAAIRIEREHARHVGVSLGLPLNVVSTLDLNNADRVLQTLGLDDR